MMGPATIEQFCCMESQSCRKNAFGRGTVHTYIHTRQIMEKVRSSVGSRIVYLQTIVRYPLISQRNYITQTKIHSFPA